MTGRHLYILSMWVAWLGITAYYGWTGQTYYLLDLSDRPLHSDHEALGPSGVLGHGLGIAGSLLMIGGVVIYAIRKRSRRMAEWGNLKDWLAFHIFLCVTGATLVTYHTAFKFGGLVSISYWSMVGVVVSGVLGRYVYVRIPRDRQGNETSAKRLDVEGKQIAAELRERYGFSNDVMRQIDRLIAGGGQRGPGGMIGADFRRLVLAHRVRRLVRSLEVHSPEVLDRVTHLVRRRAYVYRGLRFRSIARRILHYWHVIHLPFTVVMFLIMFIHVAVAILFGSTWIL